MNFVAALLYAVSSSVLLGIALGFAGHGLSPRLAALALTGGALVGLGALVRERRERLVRREFSGAEWAAIVAFTLFSLRAFLWLVFVDGDSILVLSPNNLGDLSLHLTYIRHLAQGAEFWPENPIFAGGSLTYPLGSDLFNSLLSLVGVDDLRGLIWVGLAGCFCTGVALWRWGGAFALAGFLGSGGLAGLTIFSTGQLLDFQSELAWKSLPLALFVTQRGLLFALPAGLLLLASWRARYFEKKRTAEVLPRWGEVLLYAALPVFHFHTFLFLSIVLAVWFAVQSPLRRSLAVTVGAALIPATVLVLFVTGFFRGASMLGWKPGWMQGSQHFLTFWIWNFGALPFFVGALLWKLSRAGMRVWPGALVFTGVGVFLLCCLVKFAPWEWDNTKLMLWSYLVVLPFLWSHLIARWPRAWRAAACTLLFFSGWLSLLGGLDATHTGFEIATRSRLDGVAHAVRGLPIGERFVGWPTYNHPLLLLGRKMALGYTGHAWSHGLTWEPRADTVGAILRGEADWRERCAALGVRYLFWGPDEAQNVPDSAQPWRQSARLVESGSWGALYDLATAP